MPSNRLKRLKKFFSGSRAAGWPGGARACFARGRKAFFACRGQASFEYVLLVAGVVALLLMVIVLLNSVFRVQTGVVADLAGAVTSFTHSLIG